MNTARFAVWRTRGVGLVVACLTALGGLGPARAATIYWNGTEATWSSATAWSTTAGAFLPNPGSVPGAADDVNFSIAPLFWANQTVNLGVNQAALSLAFNSGGTTLLQGGGTDRVLTLGSGGITVANNAGVVTLGSGTAGQGVALALDGNQIWTNNSVSPTGASTLNVQNGVSRAAADTTSRTLTLDGAGFTTISGLIANGGASGTLALSKTATGTLLVSGANTFSGGVSLSAGTLRVGNAAALGTGMLTWAGGTLSSNSQAGAFTLTNAITLGADVTLGSILAPGNLTLSGAMSLTGNRVLTVNGTGLTGQTLSGVISGTGFGLTKRGAGALTLSGANTFTGGFTLDTGAVRIGTNTALGTGTLVLNGGLLSSNAATTGGDRTLTNAVTLGGDVAFGDGGSNGLLTFSGNVTLSGTRALVTNVGTTFSGVVSGTAAGLTKRGTATLTLSGANTFTGGTVVDAGNLTLSGTAGAIAASSGITVNQGGTLLLDNTAGNVNRVGDTVTVTLAGGGELSLTGNGTANTTETIGTLALGAGNSTVTVGSAASRVTTLAASGVSRTAGATALVRGTSLNQSAATNVSRITLADTSGLAFVGSNTLNNGGTADTTQALQIVPYLFGDTAVGGAGSNFVTYDTTLGLRVLLTGQQTTLTAASTTAAQPINAIGFSGNVTAASLTLNSLLFSTSGQTLGGATSTALTINSGAIASTVAAATIAATAPLTLGNGTWNEGVITVAGAGTNTLSIAAPIGVTGGGGLTKAGGGTLGLGGANTYSGGTTITAGTIRLDAVGALGATAGGLALGSAGTLNMNTRSATVGVLSGSGTITNTAAGSPVLTVSSGTYSGSITSSAGTLGLTKTGPGTLTLSGINTFTGTTTVSGGTLALQSSLASPVTTASGTSLDIGWSQGLMGLYTALNIPGGATAATLADLTALNTSILANSTGAAASSALRGTNFDFTGNGSGFPPPHNTGAQNFVARWTGQFNAETAGAYAFSTESDDGSVLFINGQQVVFNNYNQGLGTERGGTIDLAPGWHDITVGFRQGGGGYGLSTWLQAPGGAKTPLPNSLLRSAPAIGSLTLDASATMSIGAGGVVVNQTTNSAASGTISGSGSLTKVGAGTLTLDGTNLFTGGTILQSGTLVLAGGNDRLAASGPITLGGNSTFNLGSNSQTTSGLITLGGGTLTNGSLTGTGGVVIAGGTLGGTATLTSPGVAYTGQSGLVTLGLAGDSGLVKTTNGTLALRGTNSLTGGFAVNAGTLVFNTTGATGTNAITLSGGNLQFLFDGDGGAASVGGNGTGAPQILDFADPLTVTTSGTVTVGRRGDTYAPLFTTASNKTARLTDLSIGGQNLVVANNNGYGLEFSGTTTFTAAPTFTVNNATASNVIPGLSLSGPVTGAFGLTKAGNGTLALGNSSNDFAGPITVAAGRLAVPSDAALGAAANGIVLANNAGLRATGSFSTARDIRLAGGSNVIETTAGNTLTLSAPFSNASATTQVIKADNGTLVLAAASNPGWGGTLTAPSASAQVLTGGLNVSGGSVLVANPLALGSTTTPLAVTTTQGAQIELAAGITLPNPVSLNTATTNAGGGFFAGREGLGTLFVRSGTATVSGVINMNNDGGIGAATGSTLVLSGGINNTGRNSIFSIVGGGDVNVTGGITAIHSLYKLGSGTTRISSAVTAPSGNGLRLYGGGGTLVFEGAAGTMAANTLTAWVVGGDTLRLDNTGANVNNRLGGTSPLQLNDGRLLYVPSGTTGSSETFGTLTATHGRSVIRVDTTAQNSTLTFAGLAANVINAAGTLVFEAGGTGATFGTAQNTLLFTAAPTLTPATGILARGIVLDSSTADGANFATYGSGSIRAFTAYDTTNLNAVTTATNTIRIGSSVVMNTPTRTINAMKLTGGGIAVTGPGSALTLTASGILATGGASTIGGGMTLVAPAEVGLNVASGSTLTLAGPINASSHITKGLDGTAIYAARQYVAGGNWYAFSGGTTVLSAGDNTLFPGVGVPGAQQNFSVSQGATVDLNGTAQLVGTFYNPNNQAGPVNGGYENTGGTITSTAPALFASRSSNNTNQYFGGQITGAVSTLVGGTGTRWYSSDNTFTGRTAIVGGSHVLTDAGRFSGTSGIDVNYGLFYLRNSNQLDLADRVPDSAPITLRGGYIEYNGRAQTASTETLGAVSLDSGWNSLIVTVGGTGVHSSDLTLTSLTRPSGSTGVVRVGTANGQLGSASRLLITAEPTLTNNIIGPWAVQDREWASYVSSLGVAQLSATGFAGYSATALTAGSNPTSNVRVTANATLTGDASVNTLAINGNNLAVNLGGNTLTATGGGLIMGTGTDTTTMTLSNGTVTAGAAGVGGDLYMHWLPYGGGNRASAISARVADNAGGAVRLVLSSPDGVGTTNKSTLTGLNVHTGGTVINGGQWDLAGSASQVILPAGGLTLNQAGVTMLTNSGQIAAANSVTLNGSSSLTLVGNNTLAGLTFDNTGGTGTPTVTTGGTLTLSGGITASGYNPASISTINGTLDFQGANRTIAVAPLEYDGRAFAPFTPNLNIGALIQNAGTLTVSGGGVLQLGAQNTFVGGVSVGANTGLFFGAGSTQNSNIPVITSGPVGTGTLALGTGARLMTTGAHTIDNPLTIAGNLAFEGTNNLTLRGSAVLAGGTAATFSVLAPQMTATLSGGLGGGAGTSITKTGNGVLVLSPGVAGYNGTLIPSSAMAAGGSTFSGGFTAAGGTVRGEVYGGQARPFGTGTLTMDGSFLQLRTNGPSFNGNNAPGGVNGILQVGNDVTLAAGQSLGMIELTTAGTTGNTFQFGTLTMSGTQQLRLTGSNSLRLAFSGGAITGTPSFDVGANVGLALPGGFATAPSKTGAGTLFYGGTNTFASGTTLTGALLGAAPTAGTSVSPFGTGQSLTLANGSTLPLVVLPGSLDTAGFTAGGLLASFYNIPASTNLNSAAESGVAPVGTIGAVQPNDGSFSLRPITLTAASLGQGYATYTGLLEVTNPGVYSFITAADDQSALVINGSPVMSLNVNGGGQGINDSAVAGSIQLTAGTHAFAFRVQNNGAGGGGFRLLYSGPDTASNGTPGGFQAIPNSKLSYQSAAPGAGNGFLNAARIGNSTVVPASASVTIDGQGSDFSVAVADLTLGTGSTLNVANQFGAGWVGVSGLTTIGGAGVIVSPNTASFALAGGVADSGAGLTKAGPGTLLLGSSGAGFTGALTVRQGVVQPLAADALPGGGTVVGSTMTGTFTTTNASTSVTTGNTAGLYPGMFVLGTGIANGTTIASITNATTFVLSANATAAGSPSLTFVGRSSLDLAGLAVTGSGTVTIRGNGALLPGSTTTFSQTGALYNSARTPASLSSPVAIVGLAGVTNQIGGYGDMTLSGAVGDGTVPAGFATGTGFTKIGNNTLTLSADNTGLAGAITVSRGVLRLGSAGALGTNAGATTISSPATLDLAGFSTADPLTINGAGLTGVGAANRLGAVINTGTAATVSGAVTLGSASSIGNAAYTWSPPSLAPATVPTASAGSITVSGAIGGAQALTKVGNGTVFLTNANSYSGATNVNLGTLVLSGLGRLGATNVTTVNPTGTLVFDNTTTNNDARSGSAAARGITLNAANFNLLGGAANTAESLGTGNLLVNSGFGIVTLAPGAGSLSLAVGQPTAGNFGTILYRGTNLGVNTAATAGAARITYTTAPATVGQTGADGAKTKAVVAWGLVDTSATGSGTSLATFSTSTGLRALAASEYDLNPATITNNNNVYFNSASLTGAANANLSPNSLTLQGTAAVTLGARSILNNQSGGFLATGTGNVIGGGNGFVTGPNTNAIQFHVAGGTSALTVSSPIGYTGAANPSGWTKSGDGTLVLSAPTFLAKNVYVNSGTLQLAGTHRLFSAPTPAPGANVTTAAYTTLSGLSVASGGSFDLAGNDQWIGPLFGTSTNGGQAGGGGIVTNSSGTAATFRMMSPAADTVFGGSITGNLNLIRQGGFTYSFVAPNTFSGAFTTTGGNTRLIDLGTFENASAITVRNTVLTWDDTSLQAVANRLPAAAPINLAGGAFSWNSRADLLNTVNVGAVNMVRGSSVVNVTATAGGSATLSLAALGTRAEGATVTFGGNAVIGSNPFITLTAAPTLTNGLIGGWAVTNTADPTQGAAAGGFVTYDPVAGVRALVGYATTASTVVAGNNVRFTGNATLLAGTNTANSLSVANNITVSFAAANDLLDLQSGGLLFNATNSAKSLGSTAVPGRLTAGGSAATTGTRELFIHTLSNAATVNSNIVDNPAGAAVALVVGQGNSAAGPVTVLAGNNTYTGTTYVNGTILRLNSTTGYAVPGNLVINGGATTTGSLSATQSLTQLLRNDQVAPTATVTINGGARFDLNTFTNQIANIVFNNDGGETSVESPAILTNIGTLTLTGSISVPTPTNPSLVPLVAGNLSLGFGSRTVAVDPVAAMPYQIGLAINSGVRNGTLAKTGNGVLFLGGVSGDTAAATVSAGTLTLGNSGYLGGRVTLGSGTLLDMRGGTFTVGSLAGSGTITNDTTYANANTAGTLITGLDGTSTTFSGTISNFENNLPGTLTGMPLNLTKIGTGTLTLTAAAAAGNTGTLAIQNGGIALTGTGGLAFGTYTVTGRGTLSLDNTATAANNRLGGANLAGGSTARGFTLAGGSLAVTGNAATAVSETLGNLTYGNGGSVITLDAADTAGVTLAANNWSAQGGQNSMLVRGTGLGGGAAGPGRARVTPTGTFTYAGTQGGGAAGTTTISVRGDILADTSATGLGTGFATNGANGLRPLDPATELLPSVTSLGLINNASTTQNVGLASAQSIGGDTRLNTLTLFSGGGLNNVGNAPTALTVNAGAILAFEGNTSLTGRTMSSAGITMDIHVIGPAATLALDTAIVNTTSGVVKAGDGTLTFGRRQYFTGPAGTHGLTINGGTVTLAPGVTNTILVQPTATTATFISLYGNGGTLDLNGTTQMVERLQSQGTQPGAAGGITSASGGMLVTTTGTGTTFAGPLTGGLAFQKAGNSTLTLLAESGYTGATTIRGGGLTLRDSAALTGTSSVDVNQATLTLDNTGLTSRTDRIGFAGVTLRGGTMAIFGRQSTQESQTLFGLALDGGMSTVTLTTPGGPTVNGSSYDLTVFSVTPSIGATANFTSGGGTLGGIGGAPRLTVPGGTNTADIIGGWAVANGSNWATYRSGGIIGAMSDTSSGFATYGSNDLGIASGATVNVNDGTGRTGVTTRTINSLRSGPGAALTTTFGTASTPATLTVASGGILTNANFAIAYNAANIASAIEAGNGNPLYVFVNQNTTTLGARILGSGGLTKSGNATLTLNPGSYAIAATASSGGTALTVSSTAGMAAGMPVSGTGIPAGTTITSVDSGTVVTISQATTQALSATSLTFVQSNRYTGTTYANGGGVLNLSGPAGSVVIPGDLVLAGNNSRVAMNTNAGQIAPTANVTINGGGVLTLVGTNTLNALTFNNIGGTTQPSVATATLLNLSAATPITAVNDNTGTTPLVSGAALALTNATPTIDVSGLSPMGLVIQAPITAAGGQIQKTGTGSLVLSGASTFTTGINVTAGTLIVDNNAGAGTGSIVFADGTSLMGGSAARAIANAITLDGNIALGGVAAANAITVSGAVSMGSGRRTITVEGFPSLATLSGAVGGTGGLEKAGLGQLTLSGTNTYSGGTFVNEGIFAVASDAAFGSVAEENFVTLAGGTLRPTATFAPNANHRIVIGPAGGTIDGNGQGFTINAADLLTGSGPLVVQGNGFGNSMLSVSVAQSSLTSDIRIASGRILTSGTGLTNPLGTGAISVGESTSSLYVTTTNSTYSNPLRLFGNGGETRGVVRLNASGNTFSGPITLLGNASLLADGGNTTTFSGTISGNFGAFFGGQISGGTANASTTARYIVTGTNSQASTYIGAGTLAINADAALGAAAAPLTINTGTLQANAATVELAAGRTITLTTGTTGNFDTNGNDMTIAGPIAATNGNLLKVGLGSLTLGGTAGYTGATTINQGTLVVAATPAVGSGLAFGTATTITTVGRFGLEGANATYNSLTVRTNSASDNVLSIASGRTLTINGDVVLTNATDGANTRLTTAGGGSLVVNGGSFRVGVNTGGIDVSGKATLDLSGLSSLTATMTNNLTVQAQGDNNLNDPAFLILAAGANTITTPLVVVGGSSTGAGSASSTPNTLLLGGGTNAFNTNTLRFGSAQRDSGRLAFAGGTGSMTLRAANGTDRTTITMGPVNNEATGYTVANVFDTTGHTADLLIGTLTMAPGTKAGAMTNTFSFDAGTLDIATLDMAKTKGVGASTNTMNIGGGTVLLGNAGTGAAILSSAAAGIMNITGGTLTSSVPFTRTGAGSAAVNLSGGTLDLSNTAFGSLANTISLAATAGTLRNVASINGTAGLVKTGTGLLRLEGVNAWTGGVTVSAGTLEAATATGLGTGNVTIAAGSLLRLLDTPAIGAGNTVAMSAGGALEYASGVSANLLGSSSLAGWSILPSASRASTAALLFGTVPAAGSTLSAAWTPDNTFFSDILSLSGTGPSNTFVLSMAYDPTISAALLAELNIARRPGTSGEFTPIGTLFQGAGTPWTSVFVTPGQYGVDTVTQTVWAVGDANSQFIVVPEPKTLALMAMAAAAAGLAARRRRRG